MQRAGVSELGTRLGTQRPAWRWQGEGHTETGWRGGQTTTVQDPRGPDLSVPVCKVGMFGPPWLGCFLGLRNDSPARRVPGMGLALWRCWTSRGHSGGHPQAQGHSSRVLGV